MAPHLTPQLKELIVKWRHEDHKSVHEISELATCSERTVYQILHNVREHGQINDPHARSPGRPRILDYDHIAHIRALITVNPAVYLDEIQESLLDNFAVDISVASISRALHHISLSHKFISRSALEQNELLRATWIARYGDLPMNNIFWIDESSVDNRTNQRTQGWAELGRACVRRDTFIRGQRFSVLPALSVDGIVVLDIFEGSVTKERFLRFLNESLAPKLNPHGQGSIVILDNCSIHHDEDIRRLIEDECGARLIYLPPYSPDMNPIEQAFSSIKAWLRRHEAEATQPEVRPWLIHQAAHAVSAENAMSWILNCGYS